MGANSEQPAAEDLQVLIVGGSLVGLSTALFLGVHGVRCLAVERHASTAIHPRAGHFQLRTVEILRSVGLEDPGEQTVFAIPVSATEKLRRKRMMTVEEYTYARARARCTVKVTLLSPLMLFLAWSPTASRDAYGDPFELFADGLALMREEAQELARLGCPLHPGRRPGLRPARRPAGRGRAPRADPGRCPPCARSRSMPRRWPASCAPAAW